MGSIKEPRGITSIVRPGIQFRLHGRKPQTRPSPLTVADLTLLCLS